MNIQKIWILLSSQVMLKVLVWNVNLNQRFREIQMKTKAQSNSASYKLEIAHISTNSIKRLLDLLSDHVKRDVGILIISETKTDESFPVFQFETGGFNIPIRVDRHQKGGGIMFYVRKDLPAKLLSIDRTNKSFFVELNLKRTKWLISYSYNRNIVTFIQILNLFVEIQIHIPQSTTTLQ